MLNRYRNFFLLIIALLLIGSRSVQARSNDVFTDFQFNQISTDYGLSQSSVLCICQDNYGFIWMGTKDGLNRFDGYDITVYKKSSEIVNSISHNEITCVELLNSGDLFVGTKGGGLNKYKNETDSFYHAEVNENTMRSVQTIYTENDSVVWIGSQDGLFRGTKTTSNDFGFNFEGVSENVIYKDAEGNLIPAAKIYASVLSILKIKENAYLVGTEEGVFFFDLEKSIFQKLDIESINQSKIFSIIARKENEYIFGGEDGVAIGRLDGKHLTRLYIYNSFQDAPFRLNISWTNKLIKDRNNEIWGGTRGGGFFKIDTLNRLSSFSSKSSSENGIKDRVINTLFIDKTDVLWMGTESQGAYQLDLNRKKFNHFEIESPENKFLNSILITALTGDGHNIYAGTAYNGISKITLHDDKTCTVDHSIAKDFLINTNDEVIALFYSSDKTLWVGSANNFISYMKEGEPPFLYPTNNFVTTICEDSKGDIWYGTAGGGFGTIDLNTKVHYTFNKALDGFQSLSSDFILSLFEDNSGQLWIGTKGGGLNSSPLRFLKQNSGSFVNYTSKVDDKHSLSGNDVYCIFQDSNDDIWVGTSNGLSKIIFPENIDRPSAIMQGKISFVSYAQDQGLPNNTIYGIREDENKNLWISTVHGLCKMNINTLDITNYDINDGLLNNEFHSNAYYQDTSGNMFFGGINGITFFNPVEIASNPYDASVEITGLKVNNKIVKPGNKISDKVILSKNITSTSSIVLSSQHRDFSIEVSAMHYANPNNVRYRYRLIGYNDKWRESGKLEHWVNYTNIFEGDYIFQVQATNNDGKWSDSIAELKIVVAPPFFRSQMALISYIILMAVLLYFFRRYSVIGVKDKNKLKLHAFEQRKTAEITEAKTRFFTNISQEIRTPLTLIYSPLDTIAKEDKLSVEGKNSLRVIRKNVDRLLELTNQLTQLRKIDEGLIEPAFEKVELRSYIEDILEHFEKVVEVKGLNLIYKNDFPDSSDAFYFDKEMITTVLYNLISNSVKFTPLNGEINLEVYGSTESETVTKRSKDNSDCSYINFKITDSGKGIPSDELPYIFNRFYQPKTYEKGDSGVGIGLSLIKEYIELHKGSIFVENAPGKGASFLFKIPKITEYNNAGEKTKTLSTAAIIKQKKAGGQLYIESEKPAEVNKEDKRPLILIAEDDAEMSDFLLDNLKDLYQTIVVKDGKKAWNIVQKHHPNLIISNIDLNGMTGSKLCSMIKGDSSLRHIPFILLSGQVDNEDIIDGYEQGADLYISKPFSVDLLKVQVNQLLNTRQELIELYSRKVLLKPRDFTITPNDEKFLTKIMNVIEKNMANPDFDITTFVGKMNMSHSWVLKKMKELTGVSLVEFLRIYRLNKAAMIFEKDKLPISEVAYMTGFSDPKYFSRCFAKQFGVTPTNYINQMHK